MVILFPAVAVGFYLILNPAQQSVDVEPSTYEPKICQTTDDPDLRALADKLVDALREKPGDVKGWELLAKTNFSLGCYIESAETYAALIDLDKPTGERLASLGEAIVLTNDGVVTDWALAAFNEALVMDATSPMARYYVGLRRIQQGETRQALEIWLDLLEESTKDAPYFAMLDEQIQLGLSQLAADVNTPLDQDKKSPGSDRLTTDPLSEHERVSQNNEIDKLIAHLNNEPTNFEGWQRLVQSYAVLGQKESARAALREAVMLFMTDPQKMQRLMDISQELELQPQLPEVDTAPDSE